MKYILLLSFIFSTLLNAIEINDGVKISNEIIKDKSSISKKVRSDRKQFDQSDLKKLEKKVYLSNQVMKNNLKEKESQAKKLIKFSQKISDASDIKDLKEQLKTTQTALIDASKNRDKALKNINYKGMYLIVLEDIDLYGNTEDFTKRAIALITPDAIQRLNGSFIQSVSKVENGRLLSDVIKQKIQGQLSIEATYMDKINTKNGKFIYLAKVSVAPLKGRVNNKKSSQALSLSGNVYHIKDGVPNGIPLRKEVEKLVESYQDSIIEENLDMDEEVDSTLENYNITKAELDSKIKSIKRKIQNKTKTLKTIYKRINLQCKSSNCTQESQRMIEDKLKTLYSQRLMIKSEELFFKHIQVIRNSNPTMEIAVSSLSIIHSFEDQYSKVEHFSSLAVVKNGRLVKDDKNARSVQRRDIEYYYIYPTPTDNGFDIGVVAKFKMNSVNSNSPKALYELGKKYYMGELVKKDYKKAVKYFTLSSNYGYSDAQALLGHMYETGRGVKKDYKKAVKYYTLGANQGNERAQNELAYMYKYGKGVKKDYKKAMKYYTLSANRGNRDAQNSLGFMYYLRVGVKKDNKKAVKYYTLSANQGSSKGMYYLGEIYQSGGYGVKRDYKKAVKYYTLSANKEHSKAQDKLANMYYYGKGVKRDYKKAVKYYTLSANQGSIKAKESLTKLCKEHPSVCKK